MRPPFSRLLSLALLSTPAAAQSLQQQLATATGLVQVIFPSRASACGDGQTFIRNGLGFRQIYSGDATYWGRAGWNERACVRGPVRVAATLMNGEVTRARTYVGPIPTTPSDVRSINASASEAAAWMAEVITRGTTRGASDMLLPLTIAEGPEPWPLLLKVARDENRPRELRRNALSVLSTGVNDRLGLSDVDDRTDDDEMRTQAVYVLSQRPKSESVPQLIELARSAKHASARKAAIYWLGQSGDVRAVEVYAELLGIR